MATTAPKRHSVTGSYLFLSPLDARIDRATFARQGLGCVQATRVCNHACRRRISFVREVSPFHKPGQTVFVGATDLQTPQCVAVRKPGVRHIYCVALGRPFTPERDEIIRARRPGEFASV